MLKHSALAWVTQEAGGRAETKIHRRYFSQDLLQGRIQALHPGGGQTLTDSHHVVQEQLPPLKILRSASSLL